MKPPALLDEEARAWLAAADETYEPSLADRERVKVGVARALTGLPYSGATGLSGAGEDHAAAAGSGTSSGLALGLGQKALLGVLLIGGAGFLGGFLAGRQSVEAPVPTLVAPDPAVFENTTPQPIDIAPEMPPPDTVDEPRTPHSRTKVAASNGGNAPSQEREDSTSTLWQETQLLRRAQRALRGGNSRLASALLDQLVAEVPKGVLVEERAAARVLADCGLGHVERARRGAQSFFERYPTSVHRERLQRSCAQPAVKAGSKNAHPSE